MVRGESFFFAHQGTPKCSERETEKKEGKRELERWREKKQATKGIPHQIHIAVYVTNVICHEHFRAIVGPI